MRLGITFGLIMVLSDVAPVQAITIVTNFISEGNTLLGVGTAGAPSTYTSGTGNLQDIVLAAANRWEQLILDDFTLTLNFGWFPTEPISVSAFHQGLNAGGLPQRELEGSIAFNNDNSDAYRLFLDETPSDNAEFGTMSFAEIDLGAGLVNTRRDFPPVSADAVGSIDLYSSALHEIGHALGLTGWPFFLNEVADGDVDVAIPPFSGSVIPVNGSHIDIVGPLMSSIGRHVGHRRDVTQVDLLAVCEVSQFTSCLVTVPGDANGDGRVDGFDYIVWAQNFGDNPAGDPPGSPYNGDFNDDGVVDGLDYVTWAIYFGQGSKDGAAVPEPTSLATALLAFVSLLTVPRRMRG